MIITRWATTLDAMESNVRTRNSCAERKDKRYLCVIRAVAYKGRIIMENWIIPLKQVPIFT